MPCLRIVSLPARDPLPHRQEAPVSETMVKLPDAMGVWSDGGDVVWLPREHYPTRMEAIRWAMREWAVTLPEVRCRSRWLRYEPHVARNADGSVAWAEDYWIECAKDEPGAFPGWRLEAA